jgi:hypothetical protein
MHHLKEDQAEPCTTPETHNHTLDYFEFHDGSLVSVSTCRDCEDEQKVEMSPSKRFQIALKQKQAETSEDVVVSPSPVKEQSGPRHAQVELRKYHNGSGMEGERVSDDTFTFEV